jgi:hypothetical protein
MRAIVLALLLAVISGPALAKLGTGTPRIWLGHKMAYGAEMVRLTECVDLHGYSACSGAEKDAAEAVAAWNQCLDGILLDHGVNLLWPDPIDNPAYVEQMDFRARLAEDLMHQGGYVNLMLSTCLPGQTVVLP